MNTPARSRNADYKVKANDVIYLKLVAKPEDLDDDSIAFHPKFTHQIFKGEEIHGYKNLRVNMYFSQPGLFCLVEVTYDDKLTDDSVTDITAQLRPLLRGGFLTDRSQFLTLLARKFDIPGKCMHSYTDSERLTGGDGSDSDEPPAVTYEIWQEGIGTPQMKEMHDRIQFYLLMYIDASSYIDNSDITWQVLCMYRKTLVETNAEDEKPSYMYECMGYMTLYFFFCYVNAASSKDNNAASSKRLRVSQVLLFPPFQRQGHGGECLQRVYNLAKEKDYFEVNIEDPSQGMQFLRDYTDIRNCLDEGFFTADPALKGKGGKRGRSVNLDNLTEDYIERVRHTLRITKEQVIRCYECLKLETIDKDNEEEYKAYRLDVKRRLHKVIQERAAVFQVDHNTKRSMLAREYQSVEDAYYAVLQRVRRDEALLEGEGGKKKMRHSYPTRGSAR